MNTQDLKELLSQLTLQDKIHQLIQLSGQFYQQDQELVTGPQQKLGINDEVVWNAGSVLNIRGAQQLINLQKDYISRSKHSIPLLFMADIINGYETIFPIPLGLGATWNPDLVKQAAAIAASEAAVSGMHITFSPMVDLVRDPRWGRVMESTGEDSYLNSVYARAFVEGYQGEMDSEKNIVACVKHFAGYGAPEAGRDYNTVDMSERTFREFYLPAYKAALDAGAKMMMTSFNTVNGIPATANEWLNRIVLRKEWGFDGVLISDYGAIRELKDHGIAKDDVEAARLALTAGVDIDMMTSVYANHLEILIQEEPDIQELLDEAVMRVLLLKNELGLFENPYRGANVEAEREVVFCEEHRKIARKVAAESLVLLKNKNHVLPLNDSGKKIALIGPYVNTTSLSGMWSFSSRQEETPTLRQAFLEVFPEVNILVSAGCPMIEEEFLNDGFGNYHKAEEYSMDEEAELKQAIAYAQESEVVVLAIGEHFLQSGEGGSRTRLTIPEVQKKLIKAIQEVDKPIIGIVFSGRPLDLKEEYDQFDGLLEVWYPGTEGARAIVDIVSGKVNPSGRLSMSFPYDVGQIPVHYNGFSTGRPLNKSSHSKRFTSRYIDAPNEPLFPFGYGLSYSKFTYTDLQLSDTAITAKAFLTASITIKNIGKYAGKETVQLYIRDLVGSVVRPVKELKDFVQVYLEPGEETVVTFEVREEMLRFYTAHMEYTSEPGDFLLTIGPNSKEGVSGSFTLLPSTEASAKTNKGVTKSQDKVLHP